MNAIIDQQCQIFPRYSHADLVDPDTATEWEIALAHLRDDIEAADAAVDNQFAVAMQCIDLIYQDFGLVINDILSDVWEILRWPKLAGDAILEFGFRFFVCLAILFVFSVAFQNVKIQTTNTEKSCTLC